MKFLEIDRLFKIPDPTEVYWSTREDLPKSATLRWSSSLLHVYVDESSHYLIIGTLQKYEPRDVLTIPDLKGLCRSQILYRILQLFIEIENVKSIAHLQVNPGSTLDIGNIKLVSPYFNIFQDKNKPDTYIIALKERMALF
jgi:hypothetical protein